MGITSKSVPDSYLGMNPLEPFQATCPQHEAWSFSPQPWPDGGEGLQLGAYNNL